MSGPSEATSAEPHAVGFRSQHAGQARAVVAFPPAGSDGRAFRPLASAFAALAPETSFHAIDPPGRGRAARTPPQDVRGFAELAAPAVAQLLPEGSDIRLFGHSFGGYVALEAARALLRSGAAPERLSLVLFASAPARQIARLAEELDDEERWPDRLRSLGGVPEQALASPFFRSLYLPAIRADLRAGRDYLLSAPSFAELSDVEVVVAAAEEDVVVRPEDMRSWLHSLPGACFATLPCGHFPDEAALPAVVALLAPARLS
ncbi:thioesterase II family protein [Segniliparus rugosus]|uniref:Thioesterase TesA n=1 Tax=Segniliparus rugosus (strain ATCC BAA-974 / DSM 45345 / CCUG 50838 / CIP 108380 / JCM 13579 / CDC 945) TaxID=679197 RepID=E5XKW0_SEGRC|nr:alpha/beta fold hydrolase [Segniliparus rugosus]EFV15010.2 hypothetical protein HMPREF9336_00129 [Segniliparus rugosus ATCC BAA-974]